MTRLPDFEKRKQKHFPMASVRVILNSNQGLVSRQGEFVFEPQFSTNSSMALLRKASQNDIEAAALTQLLLKEADNQNLWENKDLKGKSLEARLKPKNRDESSVDDGPMSQDKLKPGEKKIGDIKYDDLVRLINIRIREEATVGDLPLLNRNQKKSLTKWVWISVCLVVVGFAGYIMYWQTTDYSLQIDKKQLFVRRTVDGVRKKFEMIPSGRGWELCNVEGACGKLVLPLEARYNNYYKFVFLPDGRVYWVNNDMTDPREVRLVNGRWCHETDDSDEPWMSFDDHWSDYDDRNDYR